MKFSHKNDTEQNTTQTDKLHKTDSNKSNLSLLTDNGDMVVQLGLIKFSYKHDTQNNTTQTAYVRQTDRKTHSDKSMF